MSSAIVHEVPVRCGDDANIDRSASRLADARNFSFLKDT